MLYNYQIYLFIDYHLHNPSFTINIRDSEINRSPVLQNPQTISEEEFTMLLEKAVQGEGLKNYEKGQKRQRNYHRDFIPEVFKFGLYSGRRIEEILNVKFSYIHEENNEPVLIRTPDIKVNRIQKRIKPEEIKYIYIPITNALKDLLYSLGYEKYKGTENYIIAPENKSNRNRAMCDLVSRAFSLYYSQLNTNRNLTFKSLRKTYITQLSLYMGGNAKAITGHSDDAVIEKHYLDKQALAKAAQGFEIFPKENARKNELKELRNESKQNQKYMEVEI